MLASPPNWMCAGAESVVPVFHGALHPLRDGCLRLQICPFCGSGSIPLFFDNKRPGLHLQPGALVFAGRFRGRDRDRMDFNPRAPCGARRRKIPTMILQSAFQSTRPLRGATMDRQFPLSCLKSFQSTRPLRGATSTGRAGEREKIIFQSTRPLRGATTAARGRSRRTRKFQSTRPLRGATAKAHKKMRRFCANSTNTSTLCAKNAHPAP